MPSRTKEQRSTRVHLLRSSIMLACILGLLLLWTKLSPFFLSTYGFGPHGDCYLWNHGLVALFAGSDSLIALSYLGISGTLAYFVYKTRRDLPFSWVFLAFGTFIIACGSTHFLDVWTIWVPVYVFSGVLRFVTAVASVTTAVLLPLVLPRGFALIAEASASEERKRQLEGANRELESQYERDFRHLADVMPQIVWSSRPDGGLDYYNQRWFNYTGLTLEQTQGWGWEAVLHPDDVQRCVDLWTHAIQTGEPYEIEYRYKRASDGTYRWHLGRALPMRNADEQITKWIGSSTDIDDQKRMTLELETKNRELQHQQRQLVATNTALEEANRVRDQFLATMSHELRTPLAAIVGFSEMLLEDTTGITLDRYHRENLERILKNSEHLQDLVNDVLDLSKIGAGQMVLPFSLVNVKELVVSVTDDIRSLATGRHLALRVEIDEVIGSLETHPTKLYQILANLLSNALKFTEQGSVTLSVHPVFLSEQEAEGVAFAVTDTGIGIPEEMQGRIFEAFYQADMSYTRRAGGTGLGLSIVKQLTELLRGTIAVKSIPGQGSTFTVIFPMKAVQPSLAQDTPPRLHPKGNTLPGSHAPELFVPSEVLSGERAMVLAVDDNPDAITLIKDALRDMPYTVVGVQDPLTAIEQVQILHPDAIILDVLMPGLNGWQLLHQLKENPETACIPVIVMSVLQEQMTGYVLGADDYVIKPFGKEALRTALKNVLPTKKDPAHASKRAQA